MFHVPEDYRLIKHNRLGSTKEDGNNGCFMFYHKGYEVACIASDQLDWEHVSVTINRPRTPTWEIMNYVKDLFWDSEDVVMQLHPPKTRYINCHPHCLHLWRPIGKEIPQPPPEMVA